MDIQFNLTQIIREIQKSLNDETRLPKEINLSEVITLLQTYVQILIDKIGNTDYDQLERLMQKSEAELREHIKVCTIFIFLIEQTIKIYVDGLQEQIQQLENENRQLKDVVRDYKIKIDKQQYLIDKLKFKIDETIKQNKSVDNAQSRRSAQSNQMIRKSLITISKDDDDRANIQESIMSDRIDHGRSSLISTLQKAHDLKKTSSRQPSKSGYIQKQKSDSNANLKKLSAILQVQMNQNTTHAKTVNKSHSQQSNIYKNIVKRDSKMFK
ncbi:hypothetical protein pb186bvf_002593 [Paramecium bursaria]